MLKEGFICVKIMGRWGWAVVGNGEEGSGLIRDKFSFPTPPIRTHNSFLFQNLASDCYKCVEACSYFQEEQTNEQLKEENTMLNKSKIPSLMKYLVTKYHIKWIYCYKIA